jgi:phosphoribosylamine---glycine ligase
MKVLVIGGGGREHALAWRLAESPSVSKVYAAPGNPGIARIAECLPARDMDAWLAAVRETQADLTVVGPEAPLVAGIVDRLRAAGHAVVGPTAAAAQLEGSKSFAKDFMIRAGIPTARHRTVTALEEARAALDEFGAPVVLKTDGLAAGKGVVVAHSRDEAEAALPSLLGSRLVVEEFLEGEEVSFIVLSDGTRCVAFQPTQDHKAVWDGDRGPNTGGMGAYRDSGILSPADVREVIDTVIEPALATMAAEGRPFTGFLYAGLMMTAAGPRVLEFNARMGDPETQPLMHGLQDDLGEVLMAAAAGRVSGSLAFRDGASVCVVLAAHGYPGEVRTGDLITGTESAEAVGATVFHAGTRMGAKGLETAGGRVLGVTASAADIASAIRLAYAAAGEIRFSGMQFRSDIGAKGLRRSGAA